MSKKSEKALPETLEEALGELEKIVSKMESPDIALEESIELFERGSKLSELCSKRLQESEKKVEILLKKVPEAKSREDFQIEDFESQSV